MLHLHSDAAACVEDVSFEDQHGKKLKATQKLVNPDELQVEISLKDAGARTAHHASETIWIGESPTKSRCTPIRRRGAWTALPSTPGTIMAYVEGKPPG